MMKNNLIVNPDDRSTDFLRGLYLDLPNKTVISGGLPKSELRKMIGSPDRIIICGHGSPEGLLSVGQFPNAKGLVIDYLNRIEAYHQYHSILIT